MKEKNNTPTEVFKTFINAHGSGDIEVIKSTLSSETIKEIERFSVIQDKPFNAAIFSYGNRVIGHLIFDAKPVTRKEIIGGNTACIEAKNLITNEFDNFIFLKENNVWKLALNCEVVEVINTTVFEKFSGFLQSFFRKLFFERM